MKEKYKFKVGDVVKVLHTKESNSSHQIGEIGIVETVRTIDFKDHTQILRIKVDKGNNNHPEHYEDELELIKLTKNQKLTKAVEELSNILYNPKNAIRCKDVEDKLSLIRLDHNLKKQIDYSYYYNKNANDLDSDYLVYCCENSSSFKDERNIVDYLSKKNIINYSDLTQPLIDIQNEKEEV